MVYVGKFLDQGHRGHFFRPGSLLKILVAAELSTIEPDPVTFRATLQLDLRIEKRITECRQSGRASRAVERLLLNRLS